jgi:hypothetical protein
MKKDSSDNWKRTLLGVATIQSQPGIILSLFFIFEKKRPKTLWDLGQISKVTTAIEVFIGDLRRSQEYE